MDKRLAKRHKRQTERAKQKIRTSEPDVRSHEQILAARVASRPDLRTGATEPWPSLPSDSEAPKKADESA